MCHRRPSDTWAVFKPLRLVQNGLWIQRGPRTPVGPPAGDEAVPWSAPLGGDTLQSAHDRPTALLHSRPPLPPQASDPRLLLSAAPAPPPTFHSLEPPEGSSSDSKANVLSGIPQRAGAECLSLTARFGLSPPRRAAGSGPRAAFRCGRIGDRTSARNE